MQQSLFGEPVKELKAKIKAKLEVEEADEDYDEEADEDYDADEIPTPSSNIDIQKHSELYDWSEKCEQAQESVAYMVFEYHTNLAEEWLTYSDTLERFWKGANEGYGGHWGGGSSIHSKEDAVALRGEIVEWVKDYLAMPYHRERADDWALRGIRKENIRVFINTQCKEFIERLGGWSVEELQKEISELLEAELKPELLLKIDEYNTVGKTYDKARHKYDDLRRKFVDLSDGMNRLISPEMVAQIYTEMIASKKLQIESDLRRQQLQNEIGHYR